MKTLVCSMLMLCLFVSLSAYKVDFNNIGDLTTYFNGSSGSNYTNVAIGGLSNSGHVDMVLDNCSVWTEKNGIIMPSGWGEVLTVSAYFYNYDNGGHGGIGFSTASTNTVEEWDDGKPNTSGANWLGMAFHGGGDYIWNNATMAGEYEEGFDIPLDAWYKVVFLVTRRTSITFSGTLEIWASDSDGNLIGASPLKAHYVNMMGNAGFAAAGLVYPYFIGSGMRVTKLDNFNFHYGIVEPTPPNIATTPYPEHQTYDYPVDVVLTWVVDGSTTGCRISLGTDYPPTNIVDDVDLGDVTSYTVPSGLEYSGYIFWQITPYNAGGDASGAQIWEFATRDFYDAGATNLPTDGDPINPTILIDNLEGNINPTVTFLWRPALANILPNIGLAIQLSGANFSNSGVTINPNLGFIPPWAAFRILPELNWTIVENDGWTLVEVYLAFDASKADGDVDIIFPDSEEGTLPVTLSAFTAVLAADFNSVTLNWTVESETNHAGYNVLRNTENLLSNAVTINNGLIYAGTQIGSQINYSHTDAEVDAGLTYYYWLQSMDLGGASQYYGPLTVLVTGGPENPETPEIPLNTMLMNAFPNPFNPNTNIRYSIREAGEVNINIYNVRGQLVRSFSSIYNSPGYYQIAWDGKDSSGFGVSSGVYFYRMITDKYSSTKKMILTK